MCVLTIIMIACPFILFVCLQHMLQVIESFSTLHLVMEMAGQGDLQSRIAKEGLMNEHQARSIFTQITAAIRHMVSHIQLAITSVWIVRFQQFTHFYLACNVLFHMVYLTQKCFSNQIWSFFALVPWINIHEMAYF